MERVPALAAKPVPGTWKLLGRLGKEVVFVIVPCNVMFVFSLKLEAVAPALLPPKNTT